MRAALRTVRRLVADNLAESLVYASPARFAEIVARRFNITGFDVAHDVFAKCGYNVLKKHYYSPIPEADDIPAGYWEGQSEMPGVDLNEPLGLRLLDEVFPRYMPEFRARFKDERPENAPDDFYLINGTYMAVDAHVYYAFIRHFKPRRIVEIGSGNSTRVAGEACGRNKQDFGQAPWLTAIEPYPPDMLKGLSGLSELVQKRLQEVDLSVFTSLEANDILFIDSTHVLRAGNDVELEYLEILPRLKPGVLVHIHDISLPRRYPKVYFDRQLYWNEQQLLQAFLAFNSRFEVVWPGNHMMLRHPEKMLSVFPEFNVMRKHYPSSEPSAFWIRSK